eukprot:1689847-Rhodomonas_salina.3
MHILHIAGQSLKRERKPGGQAMPRSKAYMQVLAHTSMQTLASTPCIHTHASTHAHANRRKQTHRHVEARLGPGEHPGDSAERLDAAGLALAGARAEVEQLQLLLGRDGAEVVDEVGRLVDHRTVSVTPALRHPLHRVPAQRTANRVSHPRAVGLTACLSDTRLCACRVTPSPDRQPAMTVPAHTLDAKPQDTEQTLAAPNEGAPSTKPDSHAAQKHQVRLADPDLKSWDGGGGGVRLACSRTHAASDPR